MGVGIGQGLDLPPTAASTQDTLVEVALTTAGVDLVVGLAIPLAMLLLLTRVFAQTRSPGALREALPITLFAALASTVPAFVWTWVLDAVEFGAILGALTGLVLLVAVVRRGILVPRRTWTVTEGHLDQAGARPTGPGTRTMPLWQVRTPNLLLVGLLLATRLVPPLQDWLQSISLDAGDLLGT